mmetsp:Transcript_19595/g.34937  ORF Transcript_19595/g.34937 Transcript_19595/m.34937 type:complete len:257 (-) Transcript_19595:341-1111(-)|eukprot:CAMPEP_0197535662 /NCGR_PEP_ID=MMETSP1318-20131121/51306_1 /TAXON_ID=552666 /ORGANISM="Partenskyella glossopodia, Strain RCC365" /LENGTH=256 /DNA_ID=CAMNT_0043093303 /DNA_START=52 /DNA_END=822 /DNA_ORIENTATION=-
MPRKSVVQAPWERQERKRSSSIKKVSGRRSNGTFVPPWGVDSSYWSRSLPRPTNTRRHSTVAKASKIPTKSRNETRRASYTATSGKKHYSQQNQSLVGSRTLSGHRSSITGRSMERNARKKLIHTPGKSEKVRPTGRQRIKPTYLANENNNVFQKPTSPKRTGKKMVQPSIRGDKLAGWANDVSLSMSFNNRPMNDRRRNTIRTGQRQSINVLRPTPLPTKSTTLPRRVQVNKQPSLVKTSKRYNYNVNYSTIKFG